MRVRTAGFERLRVKSIPASPAARIAALSSAKLLYSTAGASSTAFWVRVISTFLSAPATSNLAVRKAPSLAANSTVMVPSLEPLSVNLVIQSPSTLATVHSTLDFTVNVALVAVASTSTAAFSTVRFFSGAGTSPPATELMK